MQLSQCIETFLNNDESNNLSNNNKRKVTVGAMLIATMIIILINITLGPYLWNNIFCRLVPGIKKARWYDTLGLCVLFSLIIPH